MPRQSLLSRIISLGLLGSGAILIAIALVLAMAQRSWGEVLIRAEGLARLVLGRSQVSNAIEALQKEPGRLI